MSPLDDERTGLLFRNLAILDFVALPVATVCLVLNEFLLTGDTQVSSVFDLGLPVIVAILPLTFGGVIHQMIVLNLPRNWSARRRRLVSIATSPIVVSPLLLIFEISYFFRLTLPLLVGFAVYNVLVRLPRGA